MTQPAFPQSIAALALLLLPASAAAQGPEDVLRLFGLRTSTDTHLVDNTGVIVHTWPSQFRVGTSVDLDDDGNLLRAIVDTGAWTAFPSGAGGGIQRVAFDGTVLWDYRYNDPQRGLNHHDIEPLPNGNVLLIAWEPKSPQEVIAEGRNPQWVSPVTFLIDHIVEVQPTGPTSGTIVWEWHVWDHLIQDFDPARPNFGVVADHPELLDLNFPPKNRPNGDFNHANGVDYDPIHDWVLISLHEQSEILIIDHSTTTAEAAGHTGGRWGKGGDLLYRWGNPRSYRAAPASAQFLFGQHAARFIPPGYAGAGNVTMFNNRLNNQDRSAVHEIVLPLDPAGNFVRPPTGAFGPATPIWTYTHPELFSNVQSSGQRLPNGNTLICSSNQSQLSEVTPAGQVVWTRNGGGPQIFHAHHTPRSLWADTTSMSASQGGRIGFDLLRGTPSSGDLYLLLCSASGTSPGATLFGVNIPLNPDPFFQASAAYPNAAPIFIQTLGTLGGSGEGSAAFTLPAGLPGGYRLDFAFAQFSPAPLLLEAASNSVPLQVF